MWSLGVCLYRMIYNTYPYNTRKQIYASKLENKKIDFTLWRNDIPDELI